MLAFGRLLDESTGKDGRRLTDVVLAEIKRTEAELVGLLSTTRSKSLQAILDFNNRGKPLDELALRLVCCVAQDKSPARVAPMYGQSSRRLHSMTTCNPSERGN